MQNLLYLLCFTLLLAQKIFLQHLTLLALFFELKNFLFPTELLFFLKNKILAFAGARNFRAWKGKVAQETIECTLEKGMGRERVPKKRYCTS